MKKRSFVREILFYVVIFAVIIVMLSTLLQNDAKATAIESYSELGSYIEKNEVKSIYVANNNKVSVTLKNDEVKTYTLAYVSFFHDDYADTLQANGVTVEYQPATTLPWWVSLLPTLFIIILFVVIYFVSFSKMSGGGGKFNSFGRAKVKTPTRDGQKVLFRDVAGADEE